MPPASLTMAPLERRNGSAQWSGLERRRRILPVLSYSNDGGNGRRILSCLAISLFLHALILTCHWHFFSHGFDMSAIEVDLTDPYEIAPHSVPAVARPVRKGRLNGK